MIQKITLEDARVLIVGEGILVNEIVQSLHAHGVQHVTNLNDTVDNNPLELIKSDSNYFKSFHVVLTVDQPRSLELAISDLRWPNEADNATDLPMIIMRGSGNNCKMRCQYQELQLADETISTFVNLSEDLLPWTDAKRALVASTIKDELRPEQYPSLSDYFQAAIAVVKFQNLKNEWPTAQDENEVLSLVASQEPDSRVHSFVSVFCNGGLATAQETLLILSRLVVTDAIKLLTGKGQPINNTSMEDVIKIMSDA